MSHFFKSSQSHNFFTRFWNFDEMQLVGSEGRRFFLSSRPNFYMDSFSSHKGQKGRFIHESFHRHYSLWFHIRAWYFWDETRTWTYYFQGWDHINEMFAWEERERGIITHLIILNINHYFGTFSISKFTLFYFWKQNILHYQDQYPSVIL